MLMCIVTPCMTMLPICLTLLLVVGQGDTITPADLSAPHRPQLRQLFSSSILAHIPPHAIAKALLTVMKDSPGSNTNSVQRASVRKLPNH